MLIYPTKQEIIYQNVSSVVDMQTGTIRKTTFLEYKIRSF